MSEESIDRQMRQIIDEAANAQPVVPEGLEEIIASITPEGHVDPTLDQRARAIDVLESDYVRDLVELELPDRLELIIELAGEAVDDAGRSTFEVLYWFDDMEWECIRSSLEKGPDARVYTTTHWIIANAIPKHENPGSPQS